MATLICQQINIKARFKTLIARLSSIGKLKRKIKNLIMFIILSDIVTPNMQLNLSMAG